jgi:tRNA (mo5U34)-methyltransferase
MTSFLKKIAKKVPAVRKHIENVNSLVASHERLSLEVIEGQKRLAAMTSERDALLVEIGALRESLGSHGELPEDWSALKQMKQQIFDQELESAPFSGISAKIDPIPDQTSKTVLEWLKHLVHAERYWFQKIEVVEGLFSPGWSDPAIEKLPYYGLPEDLSGMRVLDIGCAEGFFSFEAERRGAREVIGIDSFPDSVRRFNIVRMARQSNAAAFLMNVYDLEPKRLGTFDLVLFYGVFYHLKHPQLALERIRTICTGKLLFQTHVAHEPLVRGRPWARFCPYGMLSGPNREDLDPTVFWLFNNTCCVAMLEHVGFKNVQVISDSPNPFVASAESPERKPGIRPLQIEAPWC